MIKEWFLALRPWSFTAAFIPVSLGAVIAAYHGQFNFFLFLITLVGGILIQAGTNLTNTYGDYISGVDSTESARTCYQLVDNIFKPNHMYFVGIISFLLAVLIGFYLVYLRGFIILIIGIIGVTGGYTYTLGPSPYKYKGLGSILVFFLMGPLMVFGAYYVQTGVFNWITVWVSLPIGFLVSAVLHANDLRDMNYDNNAGIRTLALILGKNKSFFLYYLLNLAAFISVLILVGFQVAPITVIISLLLVPKAIKIIKNTHASFNGNKEYLIMLEANAAQFHLQFGLMFIGGFLLNFIF
ncbi:MAG: 1,4-dihydroxy-2-naphthoate octaprenyltransferase [Bacillota bacterium]